MNLEYENHISAQTGQNNLFPSQFSTMKQGNKLVLTRKEQDGGRVITKLPECCEIMISCT